MSVAELIEKLQNAMNENANVIINTPNGEYEITDVIGHYNEAFYIDIVNN